MIKAHETADSDTVKQKQLLTIDIRLLAGVYSIIPLSLLLIAYDFFLLDQYLLNNILANSPENWLIWTVFFGIPHIVASLITLADQEYIDHYNKRLFIPIIIISLGMCIVPLVFGKTIALFIYAIYTMYHVLAQQFGLALTFIKQKPNHLFLLWKWFSVIAATGLYYVAYEKHYLQDKVLFSVPLGDVINGIMAILILIATSIAWKIYHRTQLRMMQVESIYFWSNVVMVITAYFCAINNYIFLLIAIPRIIHDVTAYIIYSVHDQNRNKDKPVNYFYKLLSFTKIPPLALCPIISIVMAYAILNINPWVGFVSFYLLALFHYHFEAFMWKKGSPHREHIRFV